MPRLGPRLLEPFYKEQRQHISDALSDVSVDFTDVIRDELDSRIAQERDSVEESARAPEHLGLQVSGRHDGQLADLEHALDQGLDVIVALSDYQSLNVNAGLDLDSFPGIPGQEPERAVQVIGVGTGTEAGGAFVIVNDPAHPAGSGLEIPLADFLECWASSGSYLVLAGGGSDA